jgi:hypothetical protein
MVQAWQVSLQLGIVMFWSVLANADGRPEHAGVLLWWSRSHC